MPERPFSPGDVKSININSKVYCRLTARGLEILTMHATEVGRNLAHVESYPGEYYDHVMGDYTDYPGEWYAGQAWEFMQIFGPRLFNGAEQTIVRNRIYFNAADIESADA